MSYEIQGVHINHIRLRSGSVPVYSVTTVDSDLGPCYDIITVNDLLDKIEILSTLLERKNEYR